MCNFLFIHVCFLLILVMLHKLGPAFSLYLTADAKAFSPNDTISIEAITCKSTRLGTCTGTHCVAVFSLCSTSAKPNCTRVRSQECSIGRWYEYTETPCFYAPTKLYAKYTTNSLLCQCHNGAFCNSKPAKWPEPAKQNLWCHETGVEGNLKSSNLCAVCGILGEVTNSSVITEADTWSFCLTASPLYMDRIRIHVEQLKQERICIIESTSYGSQYFCFCTNGHYCNNLDLLQWGLTTITDSSYKKLDCKVIPGTGGAQAMHQFCYKRISNGGIDPINWKGYSLTEPDLFEHVLGCVSKGATKYCLCNHETCNWFPATTTAMITTTTISAASSSTQTRKPTSDSEMPHMPKSFSNEMVGITVAIVALALFSFGSCSFYWYKRYIRLRRRRLRELARRRATLHQLEQCDEWEVPRSALEIMFYDRLGVGSFGTVYKARLVGNWGSQPQSTISSGTPLFTMKTVAVKLLPTYANRVAKEEFTYEIALMKKLGTHPHIVSMVGCISTEPLCIVMEYCSDGDLLHYLRNRRPNVISDDEARLTLKDLLSFAWQVSDGLEYLISQGCKGGCSTRLELYIWGAFIQKYSYYQKQHSIWNESCHLWSPFLRQSGGQL